MNNTGRFILISIISLICGVFLIPVVFLITWGIIDSILKIILNVNNSKGLIFEIFWTLNYIIFYFIVGILAKKYINNNYLSIYFSIAIATILIPIVFFLWFFAEFTDSPGKEYIPRFVWIVSPIISYVVGLAVNRKKEIINN